MVEILPSDSAHDSTALCAVQINRQRASFDSLFFQRLPLDAALYGSFRAFIWFAALASLTKAASRCHAVPRLQSSHKMPKFNRMWHLVCFNRTCIAEKSAHQSCALFILKLARVHILLSSAPVLSYLVQRTCNGEPRGRLDLACRAHFIDGTPLKVPFSCKG